MIHHRQCCQQLAFTFGADISFYNEFVNFCLSNSLTYKLHANYMPFIWVLDKMLGILQQAQKVAYSFSASRSHAGAWEPGIQFDNTHFFEKSVNW